MILASTTTCPKWNRQKLTDKYPELADYFWLGDSYGWWFAVEATRTVFISYGWGSLVKMVAAHLKGNELHIPADLNLEMMARYCELTGAPECAESDPNASERQSFMRDSQRFLRAMEDALMHDGLVDQDEAERRAEICSRCPFNDKEKFSWCFGCATKTAAAKLAKLSLGLSTSRDAQLKTCGVCHCKLQLKVWCGREVMDEPQFRREWWTECWMKPENI